MPIYEYECRKCQHRFEVIQKFSDKPKKRCPECRSAVDRLISRSGFRLKGTGWYVTDYADKKQIPEKAEGKSVADGDNKADSKKSDGAKAESKKTEPKKEKKAS